MLFSFLIFFAVAHTQIPLQLQNFIQKLESQKDKLQGGAVAILHKGKVVYKSTFGKKNGSHGCVTARTLFPLGSASKPVTALSIAHLVDKGTLSFDQKFTLPWLRHKISLVDLLSHTTGLGTRFWGNFEIEKGLSRAEILELLKAEKKGSPPGKRYAYTNVIFSLVEDVLQLKKTSFQSAIRQLGKGLGTDGIQVLPMDPDAEIASPHNDDLEALPFPPYYPKVVAPAAGVFASLEGMVKLLQLSSGYRPELISQKTLNRLYRAVLPNNDIVKWATKIQFPFSLNQIESYYGLGWRILKTKKHPGKELIFHGGYIEGIRSFIGFIPSEDVGIVILVNQNSKVPLQAGLDFWGDFLTFLLKPRTMGDRNDR